MEADPKQYIWEYNRNKEQLTNKIVVLLTINNYGCKRTSFLSEGNVRFKYMTSKFLSSPAASGSKQNSSGFEVEVIKNRRSDEVTIPKRVFNVAYYFPLLCVARVPGLASWWWLFWRGWRKCWRVRKWSPNTPRRLLVRRSWRYSAISRRRWSEMKMGGRRGGAEKKLEIMTLASVGYDQWRQWTPDKQDE